MKRTIRSVAFAVLAAVLAFASACGKETSQTDGGLGIVERFYAEAQSLGFEGSLDEFLEVIFQGAKGEQGAQGVQGEQGERGEPGTDGKSAYELAKEYGFRGTEEDWLNSLHGLSPHIGADLHWYLGDVDTGIPAVGKDGEDGAPGERGEKGEKGEKGEQGERGETGEKGDKGEPGEPGKDGESCPHAGETCTVHFDLGYSPAEEIREIEVGYGESVAELPEPKRDGYIFLGWFTGTGVNNGQVTDVTPITRDLTLVARWQEKKEARAAEYPVYEANGYALYLHAAGSEISAAAAGDGRTIDVHAEKISDGVFAVRFSGNDAAEYEITYQIGDAQGTIAMEGNLSAADKKKETVAACFAEQELKSWLTDEAAYLLSRAADAEDGDYEAEALAAFAEAYAKGEDRYAALKTYYRSELANLGILYADILDGALSARYESLNGQANGAISDYRRFSSDLTALLADLRAAKP